MSNEICFDSLLPAEMANRAEYVDIRKAETSNQFGHQIASEIHLIPGVLDTITCIVGEP